MWREVFEFRQAAVLAARPFGEALTHLATVRPDVIVTDVNLGAQTGPDLLLHVRKDPRHAGIPVVAVSAVTDSERGAAERAGFAGCYVKPIDPSALVARVPEARGGT